MQATMADVAVRGEQVNVRLNADELVRAERLAAHYGLTVAFTIRMLLKREHDALFADVPPAAPSSRPRTKPKTIPRKR